MGTLRTIKRNLNGNIANLEQNVQKVVEEAYKRGFKDGYYEGAKRANDFFWDVLETVQTVKDIGPKRFQAILEHFDHIQLSDIAKEK